MSSYYDESQNISVLRERIEELSRIRQGFATHLGNSLYEATKDNEELRWGRESLYDGISACDAERERIKERIAALTESASVLPSGPQVPVADDVREPVVDDPQESMPNVQDRTLSDPVDNTLRCPACGSEITPSDRFCMNCGTRLSQETSHETCPNCGSPVEEGFSYCMTCGQRLD